MSVDVIIPAYNAAKTIRRTLDSVLQQTCLMNSIVVVDDGSRDDTAAIVRSYGPAVRLIEQKNGGPSTARNHAVSQTLGDYVAFLDSDDAWMPTKIEHQLRAMTETPEAVLCYTALANVFEDGSTAVSPAAASGNLRNELRLWNPAITPSCTLIRRSALVAAGGFNLEYRGSEDWELWLRLIQRGPFIAIDEPLTLYTVSNTGLSSNPDHMFREASRIAGTAALYGLRGPHKQMWRRKILSAQSFKAAMTARASHKQRTELSYMLRSFVSWPVALFSAERLKALAVTLRNIVIR